VVQVWFAIALSGLGLIAGDIIMARDLTLEKFWRQQRNSEIPFARLRLPSFLPESATAPTMTSSRINFLIPRAYIEDDQDRPMSGTPPSVPISPPNILVPPRITAVVA
jgi:hypothetical protein